MSASDKLEVATFRGIRFTCTSHKATVGRRIADHEFPQRDLGYHEDLGRKDREYTLEAYLVGDDADVQRDRLLQALERPGPGELFHPWLGRLWVVVRPGTIAETRAARRMVSFSLTFVEAGRPQYPSSTTDTSAVVESASATLDERAKDSLAARYDQIGTPSYSKEDTAGLLDQAAVSAELVRQQVQPASGTSGYASMYAIDTFVASVPTLLAEPRAVAVALTGIMDDLSALPSRALDGYLAFQMAFRGFGGTGVPVPPTTPNRRRQLANRSAIGDFVRAAAVARAVVLASRAEHETYESAVIMRGTVTDWLDQELVAAGAARDDGLYRGITVLKAAYVAHVTATTGTLSELRSVTLKRARPSLVLAYVEHADARRADEIVRRNAIPHPGFCPAGQPLLVLDR